MENNKKRKAAATVGAVSLVAALVLTGTYAWNSISQKAKNENIVYTNPGGRLHDDWYAADPKNGIKQVYVENFTNETYDTTAGSTKVDTNAAPIYVRVKLQTYMEYGEEAGKLDGSGNPDTSRNAKPLVAGSDMGDTSTWPVYIKGESSAFQSYFDLDTQLNTKLKYLPTFNKNKESLLADINGTYGNAFGDFKNYDTNRTTPTGIPAATSSPVAGDAYYYDANGTAAANSVPGDETKHHKNAGESHAVAETLETSKIITMEDWLAYDGTTSGQDKTGNYWIYDEDGWAYWAQPLEPGTATGPLLTDVKLKSSLGGNCYYAINVTGEFASAGDWGDPSGSDEKTKGFYFNGITDNALTLLNTLSQTSSADWVNITATSTGATANATTNTISVQPGSTVNFAGTVTLMGQNAANQEITWALDGVPARAAAATLAKSGNGATLTIPNDLTAQTLNVTATPTANPNAVVTYKVKVVGPDKVTITNSEDRVAPGGTINFAATVTKNGTTYNNTDVTWSVTGYSNGATTISNATGTAGKLTVSGSETLGGTLKVTAKSVIDGSVLDTKEIYVTNNTVLPIATLKTANSVKVTADGVLEGSTAGSNNSILGNANNTKTIEIDGVSFFVIAKKDGKALLVSAKKYKETPFFSTAIDPTTAVANRNHWKDSTIRAYLNSTEASYQPIDANGAVDGERTYNSASAGWLSDKPTIAEAAITTELKTLQEFDDDVTDELKIDTTKDKIFLLSEADVFGSTGNTAEASVPASFYTVKDSSGNGVKLVAPNGTWVLENASDVITSEKRYWLRSPRAKNDNVAGVDASGQLGYNSYIANDRGICPACWIEL